MAGYTDIDLEAFLDEALAADEMGRIESALRADKQLSRRLRTIIGRRDAGVHSLGEFWRRHRISCPSREQLGQHELNALDPNFAEYIEFHLREIGCRVCQANLEDLKRQNRETSSAVAVRRTKYLQSTAGHLRKGDS